MKTVGVLVTVIGTIMMIAGVCQQVTTEIILLGAGCAAGLAHIDYIYVSLRVISIIYLADAIVEIELMILWIVTAFY